jgi:hypothetical protein
MSSGWLADRLGLWRVTVAGLGIFMLTLTALSIPGFAPPLPLIYPIFWLFGYTGAFNLLLLSQVRSLYPAAMSGRATTALNLFGFTGTALIQGGMGLIIGWFPATPDGAYPPAAYTAAFLVSMIGCLLAVAWYLPLALSQQASAARVAISSQP